MEHKNCDRCPDEHTDKCDTCGQEPEIMALTYTFTLQEGICNIEGLHNDLDLIVESLGFGLVRSSLESPDEISEHEFEEGENKNE